MGHSNLIRHRARACFTASELACVRTSEGDAEGERLMACCLALTDAITCDIWGDAFRAPRADNQGGLPGEKGTRDCQVERAMADTQIGFADEDKRRTLEMPPLRL